MKRPLAAAAAAALVLPLAVAAVAPPRAATVLVDRGWPPYPGCWCSPYSTTVVPGHHRGHRPSSRRAW